MSSTKSEDKQEGKQRKRKHSEEKEEKSLNLPSADEINNAVDVLSRGFINYEELIKVPRSHIDKIGNALDKLKPLQINIDSIQRSQQLCRQIYLYLQSLLKKNPANIEGEFRAKRMNLIKDKASFNQRDFSFKLLILKKEEQDQLVDNKTVLSELETIGSNFRASFDVGLSSGGEGDQLWRETIVELRLSRITLVYHLEVHSFSFVVSKDEDIDGVKKEMKERLGDYIEHHDLVVRFKDNTTSFTIRLPIGEMEKDRDGEHKVTYNEADMFTFQDDNHFKLTGFKSQEFLSRFITGFVRTCYDQTVDASVSLSEFNDDDDIDVVSHQAFHLQTKYDLRDFSEDDPT